MDGSRSHGSGNGSDAPNWREFDDKVQNASEVPELSSPLKLPATLVAVGLGNKLDFGEVREEEHEVRGDGD
jgi:hypothetical protein